jgi:hypothetical protein
MNDGEIAEKKFIATLGCLRGQYLHLDSINKQPMMVNALETPFKKTLRPVNHFSASVSPQFINELSESQLNKFCDTHQIGKAGPFSKADVYINGIGFSLKYTNASPPALINHTRRTGWEFAANHIGADIGDLDALISEYWKLRLSGVITEDVANSDSNSPFANYFITLLPFLEYFTFSGTATKLSYHPASEVIEFSDPCDINTWKLLDKKQLIANLWPRLVFSVRSKKGMPSKKMLSTMSEKDRASVLRWSHLINGELKGALHVRIRR